MRTVACIVMLAGCALAGRLENTYLPPPGAAQAGGSNLATPFSAPQNNYLPPSGSGSALRGGSAGSAFSSGSSFSSGSAFNSGSSGFNSGNAFNSGSSSFNSGSKSSASSFGAQQSLQAQNGVNAYSGSFQQPTPRPALIIKQVNENPGDGSYTFSYETENGIQAQEQGQIRADGAEGLAAVQGAYAFTAPDNNQRYTVTYTADENGFLAYGDHLPTPPPVPAEILRALEQNAADEARGVVDDGQYRAEHHGAEHSQQQSFNVRGGSSSSGYGANTGFGSSGYSANKGSGSSGFGSNSGSGYGANSGFGSSGYSANKGSGSSGFGSNSGSSFGSNSGSSFGSNSGSNSGSSFGSNSGSSSPSSSGFNNNNKNTDNGYHY